MAYIWLDPETTSPSGYGSGGLNLQAPELYNDPDRSIGSGNFVSGGMTGYEIHNNFLNLGTMCLNANNRIATLELGVQSEVGDEVYKGTLLYLGRKNGYGAFFAGGRAELDGTVNIKDAEPIYGAGGDLQTDLQYKIGVSNNSLFTVTIPNTALENITDRASLLSAINLSMENNQLNGGPAFYGFESSGLSYPVVINNGDTLTVVFDNDTTRYEYTFEYVSPDGTTPLSLASRSQLKTFIQTALNQAVSTADSGVDVPPITKFISGADLGDSGSNDITLSFVTKQVDIDGTSKGSLTVGIKGEIPVSSELTTDETVYEYAFDFSAVLVAEYSGTDPYYLFLNGQNNESAKIFISNSGISNANALYYILGAIGASPAYVELVHTKAPSIDSDDDQAFKNQLLYGGSFTAPKFVSTNNWQNDAIKIHASASTTAEKQGALYIPDSRAVHDVTDETYAMVYGGILLPGNFAIPIITGAEPSAPSPEYPRMVYNATDKKIYIYDTVNDDWYSTAALTT